MTVALIIATILGLAMLVFIVSLARTLIDLVD